MTLILPQLYMPSRGGGVFTTVATSSVTASTLTIPGSVVAGNLCALTLGANTDAAESASDINGSNFTVLGHGQDRLGGPRQVTGQLEYKVLTAADITSGVITGGQPFTENLIAFFYDLGGLSVNTTGNVADVVSRTNLNNTADFSAQSGPALWLCMGVAYGTGTLDVTYSGFTADNDIDSLTVSTDAVMLDFFQESGAGPTGTLASTMTGLDAVVGQAAYITFA